MYQVRTINPLYSSKQYFYEKNDAKDYIHKIIKLSLDFFKSKKKEERKKFDYKQLNNLDKLITCVYFDHRNEAMRKCFGKAISPTQPITYEEYMENWQKENKRRHNAIHKRGA